VGDFMKLETITVLNNFMKDYEKATNSHNFDNVRLLIEENAVYFFSEGSYIGIDAIGEIFKKNWNTIKDEVYEIKDIKWLVDSESTATCVYTYFWRGLYQGEYREGSGRGTNTLVFKNGNWWIIHEHLSSVIRHLQKNN
jgi:hypothetical protein